MVIMERIFFILVLLLAGCAQFFPEDELHRLTMEEAARANTINAYNIKDDHHPRVESTLGIVTAYSCKILPNEPPASYEEASEKLRLKALVLGADGVIDVHVVEQPHGESIGNCTGLILLRGTAVKFQEE